MSIVWRATWINEYETPWSIFEKIACKNLVTRNVEDEIEIYLNNLFEYSNLKVFHNTELVHWVINKVTAQMCFNFFKEWLDISEQGAKELTIPTSDKTNRMKERSIPDWVYKFDPDMTGNQSVELYCQNSQSISEALAKRPIGQCPYKKASDRSRLKSMKPCSPLHASMIYYTNKTEENRLLRQYVDQYVLRLS